MLNIDALKVTVSRSLTDLGPHYTVEFTAEVVLAMLSELEASRSFADAYEDDARYHIRGDGVKDAFAALRSVQASSLPNGFGYLLLPAERDTERPPAEDAP